MKFIDALEIAESSLDEIRLAKVVSLVMKYRNGDSPIVPDDMAIAIAYNFCVAAIDEEEQQRLEEENRPKRGNPKFRKGEPNPYYEKEKDNSKIIQDNSEIIISNNVELSQGPISDENDAFFAELESSPLDGPFSSSPLTPNSITPLYPPARVSEKKARTREEKARSFVKPTLEEVEAYCKEKGYVIDAEAFIAHYDSNGWKVGKVPMVSWHGAITTWRKNEFNKPTMAPQQQNNQKKMITIQQLMKS